jgi:hypothetical protein
MDSNCPSAGYVPLYQHYSTWWTHSDFQLLDFQLQDTNIRKVIYGVSDDNRIVDSWSYTSHSLSATMQDAVRNLHMNALYYLKDRKPISPPGPVFLDLAETKRFELNTKVPAVRTVCLDQGRVDFENGSIVMRFPVIREFEWLWYMKDNEWTCDYDEIDVAPVVRQHLLSRGILSNSTSFDTAFAANQTLRILTIPVAIWNNTASSLGLSILKRRNETSTQWSGAACSIDARWAKGRTILQAFSGSDLLMHEYVSGKVRNVVQTQLDVSGSQTLSSQAFKPPDEGTLSTIHIDPSWYELLAPVVSEWQVTGEVSNAPPTNQTTLERLLELVLPPEPEDFPGFTGSSYIRNLEHVISTVFVDGLSRWGGTFNQHPSRFLQPGWPWGDWSVHDETLARTMIRTGEPVESFAGPSLLAGGNTTRMMMRAYFTGYAMAATGWFDYFCIAILLTHALIALAHTIWVVWHGQTSGAWDSIPELIALSQKSPSPPDPILSNTSTGIRSIKTMGQMAWIEAGTRTSQTSHSGQKISEELRLRFRESSESRDSDLKPLAGKIYGRTSI